ncbi:neuraminidase [Coccomyxa subellipsoidea C-169]|uniref:Neuraminidase n=1 Tax=Coccomyxa subellipsoidea (strain C-169) TaxID=574566 RepID=I0Z3H0_COCSC|nr:neuraminidase [Coccomyxa subellipsoidea C-169]EIE25189.1 neuraminidase [Coccomyxa subellipsoidea C-169]|eukprot:XP_005649733.1 neuraminidase [Coccomyxa subellipsoidea C-169]
MKFLLLLVLALNVGALQATAQNVTFRWVYRNPSSILDPAAIDYGKGSKNGTVNSFTSALDKTYQPRLRYNHMATLAHMPNGSIIAQWQAATKWFEGVADQAIYYAISNDHGLTWGPTQLMPGTQDNLPAWGPVLYSANGTMHLWFSRSHQPCQWLSESGVCWAPGGSLMYQTSADNGTTWTNATALDPWSAEGGIAKLACNGLSFNAAGEWLLPYWRELGGGQQCQKVPKLHGVAGVLITGDQGKTWKKAEVPKDNSTWMIENAIAAYTAGVNGMRMQLQIFRTRTGSSMQSWSSDGGYNWTFPSNSTLPNPNSRMDVIALPDNVLVTAFNDSPNRRSPLRLAISRDGGRNWTRSALIEDEPDGSFHYPALLYDAVQDQVMVIYTVSYPPRLVPISLLLPGDDTSKVTAFTTAALSPAAALAANSTKFAATVAGNVTGKAVTGRRRLLSPAAALALGDLAYESSAATGQHHVAALEDEGYISVPHKPGYMLEPDSRGFRELSLEDGLPDGAARVEEFGAGKVAHTEDEGRLLKERFVKEQSNFGRVNYGMRVAWVDRKALVAGHIFPK